MDGCERRDVASERQLIQAWADGCRLIHCQDTTTMSPEFFFAISEPLATNITLTGTIALNWISGLEDLQAVRHAFNNGTVDQSSSRQLLPIQYNNWLKMSGLKLLGWPTSMGMFMEMLLAPPLGPGNLMLENTTWTVLDCTNMTHVLNYVAFPAVMVGHQNVYSETNQRGGGLSLFSWDPAASTMTFPFLQPAPLLQADASRGNWTAQQTVSMSNFSMSCESSEGYQDLHLASELPADPSRCLSRQVTTGQELIQARLDDCRHVLALPAHDSNGTLQAAPSLSQDWYQWDRNFSVHTTMSGVVQLDVIRAPNVAPITYPIASEAAFHMWNLDLVGSAAEQLRLLERSRLAGSGTLMLTNTRFIYTGCSPIILPFIEDTVLTLLAFNEADNTAVAIDPELGTIFIPKFSGTYAPEAGLNQLFGQIITWDVTNLTIICLSDWDIQESVNRALAIRDVVPPSLQPEALAAGSTGSGGDMVPTAQDLRVPGSGGSGANRPIGTVFGVGAAVALILAVVWLAFGIRHRRRCKQQHPVSACDSQSEGMDGTAEPASSTHSIRSVAAQEASTPARLVLQEEVHQQLLSSETCMDMLAVQAQVEGSPLLDQIRAWTSNLSSRINGSRPAISQATNAGRSSSTAGSLSQGSSSSEDTDLEEGLAGERPASAPKQDRAAMQDLILRVLPQRADVDLEVDLIRDVKLGRTLGEGAYGVVYEGWWRPGTEEERHVAVKVLDMDAIGSDQEKQRFLRAFSRELDTLSRIDHPSIVCCYGGCVAETSGCLLLEYMPAGTLTQYLQGHRAGKPLSAGEVLGVALQVASALAHLHPVIIHGDVKPDNCLLTAEGHVKLGDFGMSNFKWQRAVQPSLAMGTPPYTAPEVLGGDAVDEKCDVYALAMLLWECCAGEQPWKDITNPVQLYKLVSGEGKRPMLPENCHPGLAGLIRRCWSQNPEQRPSAPEVARKADLLLATMEQPDACQAVATDKTVAQ